MNALDCETKELIFETSGHASLGVLEHLIGP